MSDRLWGGRFTSDVRSDVLKYTSTTDIDVRLVKFELWQDMVHVLGLGAREILSGDVARVLLSALWDLHVMHEAGQLNLNPLHEDVHLNIEEMLITRLGADLGGRLQTARSRNDQVSTDTRMYLREAQIKLVSATLDLADVLLAVDTEDMRAILPGYTHSQGAQPMTVAFWRTAHASMLLRDAERLRDAYGRTNECPLGSCAIVGTSFSLDRRLAARLLGFERLLIHALDATSARDYLLETAAAIAIGGVSISRMAEEIVVWSGHEYRLCQVGDGFATGSSVMPQKKNPVVAELGRGRAARGIGALMQLLTAIKGVALGYSCDLQEDKPYLWQSVDAHLSTLQIFKEQMSSLVFDSWRGEQLCRENFSTATELANYLVVSRDLAFRDAHRVVGRLVSALVDQRKTFEDSVIACHLLAGLGHEVDVSTFEHLTAPRLAVARCSSEGGTSAVRVTEVRDYLLDSVSSLRSWHLAQMSILDRAYELTLRMAKDIISGLSYEAAMDVMRQQSGSTDLIVKGDEAP